MWLCPSVIVFIIATYFGNAEGFAVPTNFGCTNSLISDDWRKSVLEFHNKYRRKLADNKQPCGNNKVAPFAKDMNELIWDCNIEQHAWSIACGGGTVRQNFMQNSLKFKSRKCTNITQKTNEILKGWWDQVRAVDLDAEQKYVAGLEKFGPMAAGQAKGFACALKDCSNIETELSCVYEKLLTAGQTAIYTKGAAENEVCTSCNSQLNPDCVAFLCQQEYTSPQADLENRACTAQDGMNNNLQDIALNMHNYYRRQVATGWMPDKTNGYAPRAKNMLGLAYDCTTNNIGQNCKTAVDNCPTTKPTATAGYALNYYRVNKYQLTESEILAEAIKSWADQISTVGIGKENIFEDGKGLNDYANLAHDTVNKLACAVKICQNVGASAVVCQYNQLSPTDGDAIYVVGAPCKCANGLKCSPLQGLCVP